ncbi:adenylosuccinate synthase [Anaerobiospirillum sp. NML120448]|uniref:adenylosuccinate synthase n=1 Tax=Anaerobiospirillum sp. NML120448 TaxID=2932816 RepID=UPI001FF3F70D|nr:adenylosuccinate synthase [Anaerobiospirillum sp. NML120448]MCK0513648.1 adenylosuccinate synthase [Anaerobiospirillum sp. NML120448]
MPNNVVVLGTQWGDEGKGKIADLLTSTADIVVRSQGGNNAGHTLVVGDKKVVVRLVPSGILHSSSLCLIGSGVVVSPDALFGEIEELKASGITDAEQRIKISAGSSLLLPVHVAIDKASELKRGKNAIGTTGRGIGPCYEDKVARRGLRIGDLYDMEVFKEKLAALLEYRNFALKNYYGAPEVSYDEILSQVMAVRDRLLAMVADVSAILTEARANNKKVLFEGAQGTFLDIDYGTYPFVTSSNTVAGGCCTGSGAGPRHIEYVLGICKAYTTRVGGGPFPTELFDDIGEGIRARGAEFGAVTGRPRRVGWYDAVAMRRAVAINSLSGLALMKIDVLDGMDELKICTKYQLADGTISDLPPLAAYEYAKVTPIYETMPGWSESTVGITKFEDLPVNAQNYIRRLEELATIPVAIISTGPERDQTIMLNDPMA